MPLDFSKITTASTADTLVHPREIFAALPAKQSKYNYLRDVQTEVIEQWFVRRTDRDLRLKMNTGGGKTLVGLLLLKSALNEGVGPAVYVAPSPYLASQVLQEAAGLGLATDSDPRSIAVARGRSILVTHIHVLLNGKSKFGVTDAGPQIPIGSLVLDDAHACLATAEQQFTLALDAPHEGYQALFDLFRSDLEGQSSSGVLEVESHYPYKLMLTPFWAWSEKAKQVEEILHKHREDDAIKFVWPLLKGHIRLCRCVFGAGRVEISPRCLPVGTVPSFARASRRIFMSATFADDSVLVTDFDASPSDIRTAIAPTTASDIGDRMILVPQELDPDITDEYIRTLAAERAKDHNVVVIVPSHYRAEFWKNVSALTLTAGTLEEGVARLKQGHVGLTVLVNKYDGIDLPQAACRLLILDGLPDARRAIDQLDQAALFGTDIEIGRSIQQIEQGMGRGVRASDDYCVVLLMGRSLTGQLFTKNGVARLTPATKAQFDLSEQVGDQVRGKGIAAINDALEYSFKRDPNWVKSAKAALVHVKYSTESAGAELAAARRTAFDSAATGDYAKARTALQSQVNAAKEPAVKGWLMAELAEYTHPSNAVEAQKILRSAVEINRQLIRPLEGIEYHRLPPLAKEQALTSLMHIRARFTEPNDLIIAAHAVIDDLVFRPGTYRQFHNALRDAAFLLGFDAQLPESEYGAGPDVLWAVGGLRYLVIECKNGAVTDTVNKHDANQLGGSVRWFEQGYDKTCSAVPVLVHPSARFDHAATPPAETRIITTDKLSDFSNALLDYCIGISRLPGFGTQKDIAELLVRHNLVPDSLLANYSRQPDR